MHRQCTFTCICQYRHPQPMHLNMVVMVEMAEWMRAAKPTEFDGHQLIKTFDRYVTQFRLFILLFRLLRFWNLIISLSFFRIYRLTWQKLTNIGFADGSHVDITAVNAAERLITHVLWAGRVVCGWRGSSIRWKCIANKYNVHSIWSNYYLHAQQISLAAAATAINVCICAVRVFTTILSSFMRWPIFVNIRWTWHVINQNYVTILIMTHCIFSHRLIAHCSATLFSHTDINNARMAGICTSGFLQFLVTNCHLCVS